MADLTANNKNLETEARAGRQSYVIADGQVVYTGTLVGLNAGYVANWDDGAADVFLGIVIGGDARANDGVLTGATGDAKPPRARVNTEGAVLKGLSGVGGTPTAAKVGDLVYCATNNPDDITLTIGALNHPIGYMSDFRSATDVDVTLFTPEEMLAQATA